MEQILTANNNKVDAVVASNDGTAGGVVAALAAQGCRAGPGLGPGRRPCGAEPRRARHPDRQRVEGLAPARGKAADVAVALAKGTALDAIDGATVFSDGPKKVPMNAILLAPTPIEADNLNLVIDAGWATKEQVCQGVDAMSAPAACK